VAIDVLMAAAARAARKNAVAVAAAVVAQAVQERRPKHCIAGIPLPLYGVPRRSPQK
jgi:hypothetical protein